MQSSIEIKSSNSSQDFEQSALDFMFEPIKIATWGFKKLWDDASPVDGIDDVLGIIKVGVFLSATAVIGSLVTLPVGAAALALSTTASMVKDLIVGKKVDSSKHTEQKSATSADTAMEIGNAANSTKNIYEMMGKPVQRVSLSSDDNKHEELITNHVESGKIKKPQIQEHPVDLPRVAYKR